MMTSSIVFFPAFLLLLHLFQADDSCNFESMDECLWYFSNSHDLSRILKAQRSSPTAVIPQRTLLSSQEDESGSKHGKDSNFYVVVSGGGNVSNHYAYFLSKKKSEAVAMIVSPYYERTSPKCELLLRHRVLGEQGSELLVTTEQLTLSAMAPSTTYRSALPTNEEDDDWIRPTLRARFQPEPAGNEPWTITRVAIGTFTYPARIRIECHASGENIQESDLNVECHVDDVQLVNCEEELFENQKCMNTKNKYMCRSGGKQLCLRFEAAWGKKLQYFGVKSTKGLLFKAGIEFLALLGISIAVDQTMDFLDGDEREKARQDVREYLAELVGKKRPRF